MSVTFDAMPIGKRAQWLAWAKSHDWGESARYVEKDGKIFLRAETEIIDEKGEIGKEVAFFRNPQMLRNWAGY